MYRNSYHNFWVDFWMAFMVSFKNVMVVGKNFDIGAFTEHEVFIDWFEHHTNSYFRNLIGYRTPFETYKAEVEQKKKK